MDILLSRSSIKSSYHFGDGCGSLGFFHSTGNCCRIGNAAFQGFEIPKAQLSPPLRLSSSKGGFIQPGWTSSDGPSTKNCPARSDKFVCKVDKREAARRALEDALGGNKDKWDRWNQEISSREGNGGGGGNKGGPGGGGGGGWGNWDGWEKDGRNWREIKEASVAIGIISLLVLFLTQGSKMVAVVLNSVAFVLRGFKSTADDLEDGSKSSASNSGSGSGPSRVPRVLGSADRVSKKWGAD